MTDPGPVKVHLHHTMTGRFPLRVLDLLFCPDRVLAVEYDYATPLDLATGSPQRSADAFVEVLASEGVAAALDSARRSREIPYDGLAAVRVFDGGWLGREKVRLDPARGSALAVRVHADLDVDAFTDAVRSTLEPYGTTVERTGGIGLLSGWTRSV